jgi:hypothetical protein
LMKAIGFKLFLLGSLIVASSLLPAAVSVGYPVVYPAPAGEQFQSRAYYPVPLSQRHYSWRPMAREAAYYPPAAEFYRGYRFRPLHEPMRQKYWGGARFVGYPSPRHYRQPPMWPDNRFGVTPHIAHDPGFRVGFRPAPAYRMQPPRGLYPALAARERYYAGGYRFRPLPDGDFNHAPRILPPAAVIPVPSHYVYRPLRQQRGAQPNRMAVTSGADVEVTARQAKQRWPGVRPQRVYAPVGADKRGLQREMRFPPKRQQLAVSQYTFRPGGDRARVAFKPMPQHDVYDGTPRLTSTARALQRRSSMSSYPMFPGYSGLPKRAEYQRFSGAADGRWSVGGGAVRSSLAQQSPRKMDWYDGKADAVGAWYEPAMNHSWPRVSQVGWDEPLSVVPRD